MNTRASATTASRGAWRRGLRHGAAARRCAASQPSTLARTWHRQRHGPGRATWRPVPGQAPCAAPGSSHGAPARRQARRAAPTAQPCPLSGAAHQRAQHRADTIGSARRARAPSLPSANGRALVGQARPGEWTGPPPGPPAQPDHLQMRQQSPGGRPPGGPGGDQVARVTGPARRGFAQVTGGPTPVQRLDFGVLPAVLGGGSYRSEHTYGCPSIPGCCTFLLYSLFEPFEFHF